MHYVLNLESILAGEILADDILESVGAGDTLYSTYHYRNLRSKLAKGIGIEGHTDSDVLYIFRRILLERVGRGEVVSMGVKDNITTVCDIPEYYYSLHVDKEVEVKHLQAFISVFKYLRNKVTLDESHNTEVTNEVSKILYDRNFAVKMTKFIDLKLELEDALEINRFIPNSYLIPSLFSLVRTLQVRLGHIKHGERYSLNNLPYMLNEVVEELDFNRASQEYISLRWIASQHNTNKLSMSVYKGHELQGMIQLIDKIALYALDTMLSTKESIDWAVDKLSSVDAIPYLVKYQTI